MKNHRKVFLFSTLGAVIVVCALVFVKNGFEGMYTNVMSVDKNATDYNCSDSDGWKNYNLKGELVLTNVPQYGYNTSAEDYCVTPDILREVYCDRGGEVDGIIGYSQVFYKCPHGCIAGACKSISIYPWKIKK